MGTEMRRWDIWGELDKARGSFIATYEAGRQGEGEGQMYAM